MSLVRAAKEDFTTMVLQERQMHMFNNNLQVSDGRGPSQADREAKFRAQQEREAEEFVDILDDECAIILEAVQSENPEYHLPKAAEKHRSKRKQQKDDASKKSKQTTNDNTTTSPAPEQPAVQPEASSLKQKLAMASDVISGHVNIPQNKQNEPVQNNKEDYSPHNPPVVVLTDGTNISTCKGCTKNITKEQRKYPNNMVFRKKGITGYLFQGRYISKIRNVHFHLCKECLRHHDNTVQFHKIMMHEEVFEELSIVQMSVLNQNGFLKYIMANFEVLISKTLSIHN